MGFGSSLQTSGGTTKTDVQDPIYLKLDDERIIRILDHEETTYWRYFMNVNVGNGKRDGRPIVVGDTKGPIAQYMARIGKDDREYRGVQKRMLLNVLDRTLVKKTSNGVAVYANGKGIFPAKDPATGEDLTGVPEVPNNKVMVIDFGSTLMTQFMAFHDRMRHHSTFKPLAIWEFDIRIVTTKGAEAKDVKRVAMPDQDQEPLSAELTSLPIYDLKQLVRPMPHEMQQRLLDGEEYLTILKELGWERPTPTVPQR